MYQYLIALYGWIIFHCVDIPLVAYLFMNWWTSVSFPTFCLLWTMLLWIFTYMSPCRCIFTWILLVEFGHQHTRASLVAQRLKRLPAMRETWVRSLGQEDPLEKEMATHSSTLAWKIPWTEEPCKLQSTGSQRVGHDWATSLHFFTAHTQKWSPSFTQFNPKTAGSQDSPSGPWAKIPHSNAGDPLTD